MTYAAEHGEDALSDTAAGTAAIVSTDVYYRYVYALARWENKPKSK